MNSKKKNFNLINNIYNIFEPQFNNNIWLITHFSNLNTLENNLIKIFCEKNGTKSRYIKINLLKRLTKNHLFLNLLSGPTKIFFYRNVADFLNFFNNSFLKKKIVPLAVYFNNTFYSYTFFYNYLKNLNSLTTLQSTKNNLILFFYQSNKNIIIQFNNFLLNWIKTLSFYNTKHK